MPIFLEIILYIIIIPIGYAIGFVVLAVGYGLLMLAYSALKYLNKEIAPKLLTAIQPIASLIHLMMLPVRLNFAIRRSRAAVRRAEREIIRYSRR